MAYEHAEDKREIVSPDTEPRAIWPSNWVDCTPSFPGAEEHFELTP